MAETLPAVQPPEETGRDLPDRSQAVTVAYVHQNEVAYSWHHSMVELIGYDMANAGRILVGGYIAMRCGSDGLVEARNKAVRHFLEDAKADWLLWIDTDMGFQPDTVERLLEAADPAERPIVGALCFSTRETGDDGYGGWRTAPTPTIFDWAKVGDQMGFAVRWDFPVNTLLRCVGTGTACVIVHRSVFKRVQAEHGPVWYDRVQNPSTGQLVSEDLSFCLRVGALDIPLYVHTGVKTTHLKPAWVAEEDYWRARVLDKPLSVAPRPLEQVAVLVPVLGRPQNAEPFMASLREATPEGVATVYAIAQGDDPDTAAAWLDAGAELLQSGEQTSFASKVNLGYAKTSEPWLFLVGDDVRFHPKWLEHAQAMAGDRYSVIGTNDLGNPRVTSGAHATHMLVRRSYIDEQGASWDGPGIVCHEGYRHCFIDDELVLCAKQRGVWAMASGSVVEHLHPAWGKGTSDATYQLGESFLRADAALFEQRTRGNL